MKFRIQDQKGNDVFGGTMELGNVYVSAYGKLIKGKPPAELEIDESCTKEYSLSGQKPTQYIIVRVS